MGGCLANLDLDDVLAYRTPRVVEIRDRRLGLLKYLMYIGIFVYIVVYNVLLSKGYMSVGGVEGVVRNKVMEPPPISRVPPSAFPYCNQSLSSVPPDDVSSSGQRQCRYRDEFFAVFPPLEPQAIFVTTYVEQTEQFQPSGCIPPLTEHCQTLRTGKRENFFVAGIENFTINFSHGFYSELLGLTKSSAELWGRIVDPSGREMPVCVSSPSFPCSNFPYLVFGVGGQVDNITLNTLLLAAGIDLDEVNPSNTRQKTYRESGVVLLVTLSYSNAFSFNQSDYRYTMSVSEVASSGFTVPEQLGNNALLPNSSYLLIRSGVRVRFIQAGTVGAFSFQTTLVQLVSSLGLLAAATVIVDLIAFRVVNQSWAYKMASTSRTKSYLELGELKGSAVTRDDILRNSAHLLQMDIHEGDKRGSRRGHRSEGEEPHPLPPAAEL